MIRKTKLGIVACALVGYVSSAAAGGTMESIFFVGDDLKSGLAYKNVRFDGFGNLGFLFGENYNKKNMTYIKPDNYTWEKERIDGELQDKLVFNNANNYAFLQRQDLKSDLNLQKMESEENEYYLLLDGGSCVGEGCSRDEIIISAVLPKKFKISGYEAYEKRGEEYEHNKDANFKLIDNTLTLYAKDVQGAAFKLWIQDISSASSIYRDVSDSLEQFSEISISQTETETKIMMPMDNVFDSGKASAKPLGKKWLKALVDAISDKNFKEIRVEGHTDNTPIKGIYPSNWELSTARASDAVRFMIAQGLDSSKIAAVGYADTRPVADNNSKENKAKNRRIEITIVGNAAAEENEKPVAAAQ